MKPEEHAWRALNQHAAAQLSSSFADRVLRSARGPSEAAWQQLNSHAARQLRPGFADRVLLAVRNIPGVPSFLDQFVLSVGTAAVCALAFFFIHSQQVKRENEQNLASWQQIAMAVDDAEPEL
jgi:hypothetical protein